MLISHVGNRLPTDLSMSMSVIFLRFNVFRHICFILRQNVFFVFLDICILCYLLTTGTLIVQVALESSVEHKDIIWLDKPLVQLLLSKTTPGKLFCFAACDQQYWLAHRRAPPPPLFLLYINVKKTSQFKTQCKGDISHASNTAKITVFDPVVCKTPDAPLQNELMCWTAGQVSKNVKI